MAKPITDKKIINDLGFEALAALGYSEHKIKKWMQRGIPWKERAKIFDAAKARKVTVPADFLSERRAA
jgi:hypothetical protein